MEAGQSGVQSALKVHVCVLKVFVGGYRAAKDRFIMGLSAKAVEIRTCFLPS